MNDLKTFTKIGATNMKGDVIIPPVYNDIERVESYLGVNKDNEITTISEPICLTYEAPYYHLYTAKGKIECNFNIKYYCVQKGILIGLLDSDGYWHITAIDSTTNSIKVIYENLSNIESAGYNHVVCRQTNDNLFVFSLETQSILIPPFFCKEIELYSQGIIVNKKGVGEIYSYSGDKVFSERYRLHVIKGVKINSQELVLAKNSSDLFGLYSFSGKCILHCQYLDIEINKHYCNSKEFITINASSPTHRSLFHLNHDLKLHLIYSDYTSISFYDCGRVGLVKEKNKSTLISLDAYDYNLTSSEIISADKIEALYDNSVKHFSIWKKNKVGVCNLQGKLIVPIKYKKLLLTEWNDKVLAKGFLGCIHWYKL